MKDILSHTVLHNTLLSYITSAGIFCALALLVLIIRFIFLSKMRKKAAQTETDFDDFIVQQISRNIIPIMYFGTFFFSTRNLFLHAKIDKGINILGIVVLTFFGVRLLTAAAKHALETHLRKIQDDDDYIRTAKGIFPIINILLWSIGFIFLLDNLGFNISAIVTGLGIGGIAVALAAQAMLGDLFSYFAILIDKPFELGDTIKVGEMSGSIEKIGIKTTRIRSTDGEQLIFSNSDLTGSRVKNMKRMSERRVVFRINVTWDTPEEKLEAIPPRIKQIIDMIDLARFDRAHFAQITDSAFAFEIVYFVLTDDYI
ncbi:MAG: mechanosensitive ion channel family protein, partial [Spirochaetota bacterium]